MNPHEAMTIELNHRCDQLRRGDISWCDFRAFMVQMLDKVRDETVERCAKVAEAMPYFTSAEQAVADSIRALKKVK